MRTWYWILVSLWILTSSLVSGEAEVVLEPFMKGYTARISAPKELFGSKGTLEVRGRIVTLDGEELPYSSWGHNTDQRIRAPGNPQDAIVEGTSLMVASRLDVQFRVTRHPTWDFVGLKGPGAELWPLDMWETDDSGFVHTIEIKGFPYGKLTGWENNGVTEVFEIFEYTAEYGPNYAELYPAFEPRKKREIVALEYFLDEDPGRGNGISIPVQAISDGFLADDVIPTESLSVGLHHLGIRAMDSEGEWSFITFQSFWVFEQPNQEGEQLVGHYTLSADGQDMQSGSFKFNKEEGFHRADLELNTSELDPGSYTLQIVARAPNQDDFSFSLFTPIWVFDRSYSNFAGSYGYRLLKDADVVDSGQIPLVSYISPILGLSVLDSGRLDVGESYQMVVFPMLQEGREGFAAHASFSVHEAMRTNLAGQFDMDLSRAPYVRVTLLRNGEEVVQVPLDESGGFLIEDVAVSAGLSFLVFDDVNSDQSVSPGEPNVLIELDSFAAWQDTHLGVHTLEWNGYENVLYHPADIDSNWRIQLDEVTAYGAAWKRGTTWPVDPNPIPIDYLTRAGALWRNGERYAFDADVASAPLWWVNQNTGGQPLTETPLQRDGERWLTRSLLIEDIPGQVPEIAWGSTGIQVHPIPGTRAWAMEWTSPESEVDNQRWGPFFGDLPGSLLPVEPHPEMEGSLFRMSMDGRSMFYGPVGDVIDPGLEFTLDGSGIVLIPRGVQGWFVMETSLNLTDWHALETTELREGRIYTVRQDESRFYRIRSVNNVF